MKKLLIRRILIATILFLIPLKLIGSGSVFALNIDTRPITLPKEDETSAQKVVKPVQNTTKIIKVKTEPKKIKPAVYRKTQNKPTKQKYTADTEKTEKNPQLEVLQFDKNYNIVGTQDTDSYLIVPIDKSQLKKEEAKTKMEEFSNSLMKDSPKPLTTQLKIKSKFHQNLGNRTHRVLSKIKHSKIFKFFSWILFLILFAGFGYLGYLIYQRRKIEETLDEEKSISPEEKEHQDLLQAMQEFEQTEEQHQKLGQKKYINELETYRNLDGFKKDEVSEDILKTLKKIETAQKNDTPLTLKDSSIDGFKKHEYVFDEKIGELTDEEGLALFDEEDDDEVELETQNENDTFEFSSNYYDEKSEFFSPEPIDNDIFIIEDMDEAEDKYNIVEEDEKPEQEVETPVEEEKDLTEDKKENSFDTENLHIKQKYPLSDNKGIALLDYHQITALIGYINDNITVLKKFSKDEVLGNLSIRKYEEISPEVTQYIARIGSFKGIIEVSDTSIKLLLDL